MYHSSCLAKTDTQPSCPCGLYRWSCCSNLVELTREREESDLWMVQAQAHAGKSQVRTRSMTDQASSAPALQPTQLLMSDDLHSLYTMLYTMYVYIIHNVIYATTQHQYKVCTQVLCYVQEACNKYDQRDTHTAVSVA